MYQDLERRLYPFLILVSFMGFDCSTSLSLCHCTLKFSLNNRPPLDQLYSSSGSFFVALFQLSLGPDFFFIYSLCRGHANPCIVPILVYVLQKKAPQLSIDINLTILPRCGTLQSCTKEGWFSLPFSGSFLLLPIPLPTFLTPTHQATAFRKQSSSRIPFLGQN